jgi:hypothetical protein
MQGQAREETPPSRNERHLCGMRQSYHSSVLAEHGPACILPRLFRPGGAGRVNSSWWKTVAGFTVSRGDRECERELGGLRGTPGEQNGQLSLTCLHEARACSLSRLVYRDGLYLWSFTGAVSWASTEGRFPLMPFVARKTFLQRLHLSSECCVEDKSAKDNLFTVGEVVPYSGVYRITHYPPHTGEEVFTLTKGSAFPRCVRCSHVSFMLIRLEFCCGAENSELSVSV